MWDFLGYIKNEEWCSGHFQKMPRAPTTPRLTRSQTRRRREAPHAPYAVRVLAQNRRLQPRALERAVRRNYQFVDHQLGHNAADEAAQRHRDQYEVILAENPDDIDLHNAVDVLANRQGQRAYERWANPEYNPPYMRDAIIRDAVRFNRERRHRRILELGDDEEVVEVPVDAETGTMAEDARRILEMEPDIRLYLPSALDRAQVLRDGASIVNSII